MRVLVTGGCGFIGAYVTRDLLREGHEPVVVDTGDPGLLTELVVGDLGATGMPPLYAVDITDVTELRRVSKAYEVEAIVHLAGLLSEACAAEPSRGALVDVVGTAMAFELAHELGVGRVLWAGSISVFGYRASERLLPDDAPHTADTFYGAYKSVNEHQARLYEASRGIPSVGIRVAFAYGYGRTRGRGAWSHELTAKPALGLHARVSGGDALVPWLYIEDVSSAFVAALGCDVGSGCRIFNTSGSARWKHEAVEFVRELLPGASISIEGEPGGYPTGLDDSAIRTEIGWSPRYTMEEGIFATVNRYRQSANLPAVTWPGHRDRLEAIDD